MNSRSKELRNLALGLAFLAPNICGVLVFTVFPVVFSVLLAFTNWDLRRHNQLKDESLSFVGMDNFIRLFTENDFLRYLGNTLFLMMGIPFAVGGALGAAILLSKNPGGEGRVRAWLIGSAVLIASVCMLTVTGMGGTGMVVLITGLACGMLVIGVSGGSTIYRTLFYTPHFTAGVATFLLWKKLFNPETGPINVALRPVLDVVTKIVMALPAGVVASGQWICLGLMVLLFLFGMRRLRLLWRDGDVGSAACVLPVVFLAIPAVVASCWSAVADARLAVVVAAAVVLAWQAIVVLTAGREFSSKPFEGAGSALMLGLGIMVAQFVFLGLAPVFANLPAMAADDGLQPPKWIYDVSWAKPSIMLMGFWGAIGSNNMLLYLAALSNVPEELYEAADIDGAGRLQRFWHVTWPQLAPTTFFILVMSTIGGLQGGFEMARTMTAGGPDGATTTLSYFIYQEAFETGRFGYASAVAWALFILVFSVTMFNWKFGNKLVNE